jgi:hypothetical protein
MNERKTLGWVASVWRVHFEGQRKPQKWQILMEGAGDGVRRECLLLMQHYLYSNDRSRLVEELYKSGHHLRSAYFWQTIPFPLSLTFSD